MRRVLNSLRGQLVLLVILALAAAQAVSLWLFVDERSLAVRAALGAETAGRAANVARLIEEAPASLHASILRAANSPLVRFGIAPEPEVEHMTHNGNGIVEERVRALLDGNFSREIRVELHEVDGADLPLPHLDQEMAAMHREMMRGHMSAIELKLSIALSGSQWLNVDTRFERPPLQWPLFSTLTFALTAGFILIVVFWFLMSRVTGPLRRLSVAADRLGRGEDVDALPAVGPCEVQDLTDAFNRMQERLKRFVADRTRLLAALGHDLRSPLTAMRVRAEFVDEEETRDSLISSIEEMQSMVDSVLAFARGLAVSEPLEVCELGKFLEQLRADMLDRFDLHPGVTTEVGLRPNAMRRALRNVIENALRYGGWARVGYGIDGKNALITVVDSGPGIPEEDLERVFDPFLRLEASRSLETGGYGLGLSIARTIARAHGGDITLANRPDGGLLATLAIPLAKDQTEIET
ncbi:MULTISPECIES: ATP-binding protein [Leisingera]|jgi:signal transduction histidine kinase|uniref:histidine kinase n=1 Tax=Leisingera caerulea TaxID=506591 RepID=A0A9Q9LW09_LEICA|nr:MULTISPECIES: ATP-binding protein [Leisingera]KIC31491.1 histidine kinase [Leisingera sp. ANG-S5]MCB4455024.1 HAMP domain-containing protein [Leisingera sp. McT4-56]UWQ53135.1 HAMP domain-containing protein [Leisingera caerulea]